MWRRVANLATQLAPPSVIKIGDILQNRRDTADLATQLAPPRVETPPIGQNVH